MSFPDLFAPRDTRRCTLVDIRIKRDPDGKSNDDLFYDLSLAYLIQTSDPDDLLRLDAVLPGASATIASAPSQNRKSTRSDTVDIADRFVTIQDPISGVYLAWQRRAEVQRVKSRVVGPASTVVLVCRVRGMDSMDASRIAPLLERELDVTYEDLQPGLLTQRPNAAGGPATPAKATAMPGRPMPSSRTWDGTVGCVIAGRMTLPNGERPSFAGMVVSADPREDGTLLYVEDVVADAATWIPAKDVESTIHVVPADGETVPDLLARYAAAAAAQNVKAGWNYLVTAFGMAFACGSLTADASGQWVLTPEVIQEALDLAAREASQPS